MGKTIASIAWIDTPGRPQTITRARLKECVEAGISAAATQYSSHPALDDITQRVRRLAETTASVDACTWRNEGSCGCPMTAIGAIALLAVGETEVHTGPAGAFAHAFDKAVRNTLGYVAGVDGILLTVVD